MTEARRVAVVTGAATRIGAYLAAALAADGYDLHLHTGRRRADLERTAQRIRDAHGAAVTTHVVDLRSQTAVARWVRRLRAAPPELVVNNASCFPAPDQDRGGGDVEARGWGAACDLLALHAVAPAALAGTLTGRGHVVNVLDARLPLLDGARPGYEVAKHALAALTLIQARHLAPGVRVNGLAPGLVLPSRPNADLQSLARDRAPLRRPATLHDLAAALLFLDRAASVTGQVLFVDAGEHLGPPGPAALSEPLITPPR